ncbi:hypothetical protein WJX77_002321 [Trebouxia sp. C0004]
MSRGLVTTNEVQRPSEKVAIVDENNTLIGSSTRGQMRAENLIHRCSFIAIFNSQGKLYVQKRVSFKETYPSFYDPAPGGVVGANESYEESAEREIEEEMGVRNVQLQKCFDFYHTDDISRVWGRLFSCTYDGTFRLDPEEVESGDFMSVKEVKELMSSGKVPPDSTACMEKYLGS